jgi:thiol-disulfide isomerase/thioredoxin
VVVFTGNHCPTAQAYEDKIIALTNRYKDKGVAVVAIMPNDPKSIRLDELGYTDLSDSFDEMKIRAAEKHFNFPYLYDGDHQEVSKKYGPIATPHVFIFDVERILRYSGLVDDTDKPGKTPKHTDAANVFDEILAVKPVTVSTTKVFGCSIKWAEKSNWITLAIQQWAAEPVSLNAVSIDSITALLKNTSNKLRLINFWATWCGPCVTEFPEFITMNRMYRGRDFEFVSISADDPSKQTKALDFLKLQQASCKNYILDTDDKDALIDAIDPKWQGALSYTILVEPGGKIVYAHEGAIDPSTLKKIIVDNAYSGRYY